MIKLPCILCHENREKMKSIVIFLLFCHLSCACMEREESIDTDPFLHDTISYDCILCGAHFSSAQEYQSHVPCVIVKTNSPQKTKLLRVISEQYKCTGCSRVFTLLQNIHRHVRASHHSSGSNPYVLNLATQASFLVDKTLFPCDRCSKIFYEKGAYLKHKISDVQTECSSQLSYDKVKKNC